MAVVAILTLDRGNTTLDAMWHGAMLHGAMSHGATSHGESAEPTDRHRLDPHDLGALAAFVGDREPSAIVALSVVAGALDEVHRLASERGWSLQVAGTDLPCPLDLADIDPASIGVDRWVGAWAAHRIYGDAIVVDCGTALTVNLVDRTGRFLGGAIGPGPWTMARSLVSAAPALPEVDFAARIEVPATTPESAVNAGVRLGFRGMVDSLVRTLGTACNLRDATLVLTGGGASVYSDGVVGAAEDHPDSAGRPLSIHHPDLIHQGLRWLVETSNSGC